MISRGHTLVEILISMALMSLIMLAIHQVLISGLRYLDRTKLVSELQQACVLSASRIVTEMLESNANSIRPDPVDYRFVSFGSPRNLDGKTTFDATSGDLHWYAIIGYYIGTGRSGEPALYRKQANFTTPLTSPPSVSNGYDEQYWVKSTARERLIAERIYYLDVVSSTNINVIIGAKSPDEAYLIKIQTKLKARN